MKKHLIDFIEKKRELLKINFNEENHKYTILNKNGILTSEYPSVSTFYKKYTYEFESEKISLKICNGNHEEALKLRNQWDSKAKTSAEIGSECHYLLEKYAIDNGVSFNKKENRKPKFENNNKILVEKMVSNGINYLEGLKKQGFILLDTETIMASNDLKMFGQCDNVWLYEDRGFFITDWKTNEAKKWELNKFTKKLKPPFDYLYDYPIGYYSIQLTLYGMLFKEMIKGSKYESIPFLGASIIRLNSNEAISYKVKTKIIENDIIKEIYENKT